MKTKQKRYFRQIRVNLTLWQRIKILFGATTIVAVEWDNRTQKIKNYGTKTTYHLTRED